MDQWLSKETASGLPGLKSRTILRWEPETLAESQTLTRNEWEFCLALPEARTPECDDADRTACVAMLLGSAYDNEWAIRSTRLANKTL